MRRVIPLLLVLASAGSARADGWYYSEGLGVAKVKDELGAYYYDETSLRARISVGMRRGDWSFEPFVAGIINSGDLSGEKPQPRPPIPHEGPNAASDPSLTTFGIDIKRNFPLSANVEVYLRGSASFGMTDGTLHDWNGRGLGAGAGIQLKGKGSVFGLLWWPAFFFIKKGPQMTGAIFLDDGYEFYRLHDEGPRPRARTAIDAQLTHVTFGVAVGTDF